MLESMPKPKNYPQQELAERLRDAMEEADVSLADLARGCEVSIQAVYDWRLTGRIAKHHLMTICRMTKKPLEYFLVGLGRAAAIAFFCIFALLASSGADAGTLHKNFYAEHLTGIRIASFWRRLLTFVWKMSHPGAFQDHEQRLCSAGSF